MPTFALNFYSPVVADQLRTGRKTATIRLGDKSAKYRKGMIVTVLVGARYGVGAEPSASSSTAFRAISRSPP